MFAWSKTSKLKTLPTVHDPQIMNGTLFMALQRSTFHDFVQHAKERQVAHLFDLEHTLMVMSSHIKRVAIERN